MTAHRPLTAHRPTTAGRLRRSRLVALPLAASLALVLGACGDDAEVADSVDVAEDVDAADSEAAGDGGDLVDVPAEDLVGLEVTFAGDVAEVLDEYGFRLDKNGVDVDGAQDEGAQEEDEVVADGDLYEYGSYGYDYDVTDEDYLTEYDEELGDDAAADQGVLVVDPAGTTVEAAGDVRVSGTVRLLEAEGIEAAYGLELDGGVYDSYEQHLVVVASSVTPADEAPGAATSAPTPSASATSTGG